MYREFHNSREFHKHRSASFGYQGPFEPDRIVAFYIGIDPTAYYLWEPHGTADIEPACSVPIIVRMCYHC